MTFHKISYCRLNLSLISFSSKLKMLTIKIKDLLKPFPEPNDFIKVKTIMIQKLADNYNSLNRKSVDVSFTSIAVF